MQEEATFRFGIGIITQHSSSLPLRNLSLLVHVNDMYERRVVYANNLNFVLHKTYNILDLKN